MSLRSLRALVLVLAAGAATLVALPASAQRTVPVSIESTPPGATVHFNSPDGQVVGTTPMNRVRLPRGSHTLYFKLANHEMAKLPIEVRRSRVTYRATLLPFSTIAISASNAAANGAEIKIDGQPVGTVPYSGKASPGRHLVQVTKDGYVTFSQWAELGGGQALALPVALEREAPQTGSVLVAGDVSGAAILIDGEPKGTTPSVIENIPQGQHQLEVRSNEEGIEPFRQTILVTAGQRVSVNPTMRPRPPSGGAIRVISNVPGAVIALDGEPLGAAPTGKQNVTPGEHIVEATLEGYEPVQQPVTIEPGQQKVVSLKLKAVEKAPGRIVVEADADGAVVFIDGEERGAPPVVVEHAAAGTHAIAVRAPGRKEFRTTCLVDVGKNCEVMARLNTIGAPVRVEANVPGAEFVVDGEVLGPIPWEGTIPIGSHKIEIRAEGHHSHVEVVSLEATEETRLFSAELIDVNALTPEQQAELAAQRLRDIRESVSHSAAPVAKDLAVLDLGIGWPWFADARLAVAIFDWLEAGFSARTFFPRLFEFEARGKIGGRVVRQFSVAGQFRIGGGIGPALEDSTGTLHETNSFVMSLEGLTSLHFASFGAFTLWVGGDFVSDKWDWSAPDTLINPIDRQNFVRLRLGGSVDIVLDSHWNIYGIFEGVLAGPERRILTNVFGFNTPDIKIHPEIGVTYKFH